MNSLMSINFKFMSINPKELVNMIIESKHVKGVEAYIDIENDDELKYLDNLVYELKRNDLILQIHGNIEVDVDKQIKYAKKLEEYSSYLGYPIVFTIHTKYNEDKKESIEYTVSYLSKLLNEVDDKKIIISLENLNSARNCTRLNKEEIRSTVLNDEKIFFTYDIGHELVDFGNVTNLDKYMIEDIRSIHLHSHDNKGNDHLPIYDNDIHKNDITKALTFLKVNNYKYNIVYEYDLYECRGNNLREQVIDFINSIDEVSEKYN